MKEIYRKTEKEKKEIKRRVSLFLKKQKEISFAYFFGSFLEKKPIGFRDIDIGIFLNPLTIKESQPFDYENNLAIQLSKLICFPADHLDIKILNFAPKSLQNNIFSRGELIFAQDLDLLSSIIEDISREAIANYEFSKQSLYELIA